MLEDATGAAYLVMAEDDDDNAIELYNFGDSFDDDDNLSYSLSGG